MESEFIVWAKGITFLFMFIGLLIIVFYIKISSDFISSINEKLKKLKFSHDDILQRQNYLQKQGIIKLSRINKKLESIINKKYLDRQIEINDKNFYKPLFK